MDNLRSIAVLMLFPYHTCMVYNGFESFYVKDGVVPAFSAFIAFCHPVYMQLMFALAGVSASYALERRSLGAYALERVKRVLVPLIVGLLLIVPMQTYYAERFHNGYTGGYLAQYAKFFTPGPDWSGYHGGFTPGHLWFLAYLFVISIAAIPLIVVGRKRAAQPSSPAWTLPKLFALAIIPLLMQPIADIGGKSLGEFFAFFLLGYFVLSRGAVQRLLANISLFLTICACLLACLNVVFVLRGSVGHWGLWFDAYAEWLSWVGVLALVGLGRRHLNRESAIGRYLARASFPIYVFHQSFVVMAAYYALSLTAATALQVAFILVISFVLTIAAYEIASRHRVARILFGIK